MVEEVICEGRNESPIKYMHYAPIFEEIVDSSLWEEEDPIVKIFLTMLVKAKRGGMVYGSAFNISRWAKKTEAETISALKILEAPDTKRLEPQPFDGRRIQKVDGGWLILNAEKYQKKMAEQNRRMQNAVAQANWRANQKEPQPSQSEPRNGELMEQAEHVYLEYPRKIGKQAAIKKIVRAIKESGFEKVMVATKGFAAAWAGEKDLQYCPYPATWYGGKRFDEDPSTWIRNEVKKKTPESGQIQETIHVPSL